MGFRQYARKAIAQARTQGEAKGLSGSALQSFLRAAYPREHPTTPQERWFFKSWLEVVREQMRPTRPDPVKPGDDCPLFKD